MPTYEYRCKKCDQINEFMHSMSETKESLNLKCKNCGSRKLEKIISSFNIGGSSSKSCPTGTCPLTR